MRPEVNAREFAVDALVRVEQGAFSNVLVPTALRSTGLDDRDRAFATDLVYGTLRAQRRLDALLQPALDRPIAELDPAVRAALRVGVYQLVHGAPPHAAVGETVAASPRRARGLVNAVLRRIARSGPPWTEPADLATRASYPDWVVEELRAVTGDAVEDVLAAGNRAAAMTLRPNPRVTTPESLSAEIVDAGATVERGRLVPEAVIVRGAGDPAALPSVVEGRATPQDQASQAVVAVLAPAPGERILDVAAAPGGKATALAERVGDAGQVVAGDVDAGRLRLVGAAAARLRLANLGLVRCDGRRLPVAEALAPFDAVLVDAPCSGLGVLRRRPEARWRTRPDAVPGLAALQRDLLREAATAVRPGGRLVYSVCTLTAAETVGVAEWAVEVLDGFAPEPRPPAPWRPHGPGALLLPNAADTDGMFVLSLRRRAVA